MKSTKEITIKYQLTAIYIYRINQMSFILRKGLLYAAIYDSVWIRGILLSVIIIVKILVYDCLWLPGLLWVYYATKMIYL